MDFDALLLRQEGMFGTWQLRHAGWSEAKARHAVRGLREIHHGVHATGHAGLTPRQRCWAAVLTEPGTRLSHASLARLAGFDDWEFDHETVTRLGNGGRVHHPGLIVYRSARLASIEIGEIHGIPSVSPARALLDLLPQRTERNAARLVRNALRSGAVTEKELRVMLALHPGRRGITRLRRYTDAYGHLPLHRTKSDAEALGLAVLDALGIEIPLVNVKIMGEEADYVWREHRWIVELDSRRWHHPVEDARKTAVWEGARWTVRRVATDDVYDRPDRRASTGSPALNV